jgi:hypothetical protein
MSPRLCIDCLTRPAQPTKTRCSSCWKARYYGHSNGQKTHSNLGRQLAGTLPPLSARGFFGDRCPVCGAKQSFGTIDGTGVEWCPTHGMTVTPLERRYTGPLYDQRDRLEADMSDDVHREMDRVAKPSVGRKMRPLNTGW